MLVFKNFLRLFIRNPNLISLQSMYIYINWTIRSSILLKYIFYFLDNIWLSRYSTINFLDLDNVTYEKVCSETLDSLSDYFDEIVENDSHLVAADVSYGVGFYIIIY